MTQNEKIFEMGRRYDILATFWNNRTTNSTDKTIKCDEYYFTKYFAYYEAIRKTISFLGLTKEFQEYCFDKNEKEFGQAVPFFDGNENVPKTFKMFLSIGDIYKELNDETQTI